ncbi:MAG: hypothetical protein AAFX40_10065 [Cyanobacteria bacterium J06639_1]
MPNRYEVTASALNFRSEPMERQDTVIAVLPRGQIVRKLEEVEQQPLWWKVSTTLLERVLTGFVAHRFLSPIELSLASIVEDNQTLTMAELKTRRSLVIEIQTKLRNLGFYPGGPWIDGLLGEQNSRTRQGLGQFCDALGLVNPTLDEAINAAIAQALLQTQQVETVLEKARDRATTRQMLADIQAASPGSVFPPYLDRTIKNSPFASEIQSYPTYLARQLDEGNIVSYGRTFRLQGSDETVTFADYPAVGNLPAIDETALDFIGNDIPHACACVGSFVPGDDEIKTHWLGKASRSPVQFLSSTKFIGVLNTISQINALHPFCDIDQCDIGNSPNNRRFRFSELVTDMVSYEERIASSNQIGAMFKRFSTRSELEAWTRAIAGNPALSFRGYYGDDPFIERPMVFDTRSSGDRPILGAAPEVGFGPNSISAYDLVRFISMLGWHLHVPQAARLPAAQWISLESVVRSMGFDPARYIDVALETLGLVNVIDEPVVISKLGLGNSALTYVALVKLIDRRQDPFKLRTFALALWANAGNDDTRDVNMAAAVTEIVRRIFTEELA